MPNQGANQEVLDWDRNLIANNMNLPDKSKLVYKLSNYNGLDYLISQIQGESYRTDASDGQVQTPIIGGNQVVAEVIATPTTPSTGVLRVLFANNWDKFRNQEIISDGTTGNVCGRVIAHGPGYVDLTIVPPVTAWSTSLHFQSGSFCTYAGQVSATRDSNPMENRFTIPKYVSNYTSVLRENLSMARRDRSATWATWQGDYWYTAQDEAMMDRIGYAKEMKALYSFPGQQNEADGQVSYSMGAKAAIMDAERGGTYMPYTSAPTQAWFEAFLSKIADKGGQQHTIIDLACGRGFLRFVQGFAGATAITNAGELNTFGGKTVEGLDSYMFAIAGIKVRLTMMNHFNDTERFPTMCTLAGCTGWTLKQMTAVVLDLDVYKIAGGGTAPAMRRCHFGNDDGRYYYVPGVVDSTLKGSVKEHVSGDFNLAVNHNDSVSVGYIEDTCYDFMAVRMGWAEPTN